MLTSSQEILPFMGCSISSPQVIQHKQRIIPGGKKEKKIIIALVVILWLQKDSGYFLVQQCHLPDPATSAPLEKVCC